MPEVQAPPPLPKSQPWFGRRHSTIFKLLGVGALVLLLLIPLGFFAAKYHGGATDHLTMVGSLIGISIPIFFLGLILKYIFAVKLGGMCCAWAMSSFVYMRRMLRSVPV